MSAQATNAERRAVADYAISTDTSVEETRREVALVYESLSNESVD
jgi:dephospho-CoA kinase